MRDEATGVAAFDRVLKSKDNYIMKAKTRQRMAQSKDYLRSRIVKQLMKGKNKTDGFDMFWRFDEIEDIDINFLAEITAKITEWSSNPKGLGFSGKPVECNFEPYESKNGSIRIKITLKWEECISINTTEALMRLRYLLDDCQGYTGSEFYVYLDQNLLKDYRSALTETKSGTQVLA